MIAKVPSGRASVTATLPSAIVSAPPDGSDSGLPVGVKQLPVQRPAGSDARSICPGQQGVAAVIDGSGRILTTTRGAAGRRHGMSQVGRFRDIDLAHRLPRDGCPGRTFRERCRGNRARAELPWLDQFVVKRLNRCRATSAGVDLGVRSPSLPDTTHGRRPEGRSTLEGCSRRRPPRPRHSLGDQVPRSDHHRAIRSHTPTGGHPLPGRRART